MPSGEGNIKAAYPPANPEPNAPAITKVSEPHKRAKQQPKQQGNNECSDIKQLKFKQFLILFDNRGVLNYRTLHPLIFRRYSEDRA